MIPDFQSLMLPVLRSAADGEVRISDVVESLADEFGLSAEERSQFKYFHQSSLKLRFRIYDFRLIERVVHH
jgi:restriction endonuclease Mrr